MKRLTIDSSAFDTLAAFFEHADKILCRNFTSGRNMNAFHDILQGGFGAFDYEEPVEIVWRGADKSRRDLGEAYTWLVDAIRDKPHITFREENG